ncbi:MAG TPA: hypothetical protein VJN43_06120 [Bryobacteraceae bacterium]|nr:hypothetical protein [Bryobacteraceae bacterium]
MKGQDQPLNYFNYFTEIEDHFQRVRATSLFLLSPLDWALIETWKNAGVPLEAVLRGIDVAFEKWRSRRNKTQKINSLAFCAQAVMSEAEQMAGTAAVREPAASPYTCEELRAFLAANAEALRKTGNLGFGEIAASLDRLMGEMEQHHQNLEQLDHRLTVLEEKMIALARAMQSDEEMLSARMELGAELAPYRSKMTAEQLAMLEKQYLERRLLERLGLPRLSLFYMR